MKQKYLNLTFDAAFKKNVFFKKIKNILTKVFEK